MITKISTNVFKGLTKKIRVNLLTNVRLCNYFVPFLSVSKAMFSTKAPKLNTQVQQSAEGNYLYEQNAEITTIDLQSVLTEYPFIHIPVYVIRNPTKMNISQALKKQIIAFKALGAPQRDLTLARSLLFPQQKVDAAGIKRQQIFDQYFAPKLQQYEKMLNKGKGTLFERLHLMNILINTSFKTLQSNNIKTLDERSIVKQDQTGALAAYYTHFLIKNSRDYTHLIDLLKKKLEQTDNPNRIYIAQTVISTPQFMDSYPQKIIDLVLKIFIQNIPKMHNYKILASIRLLYNYQSQSARYYSQALKNHLMRVHLQEGNIDFHVPLILRTIKYCSKQRVDCAELVMFISRNMQRFKIIFINKNLSKGVLFSLIFQQTNPKYISEQVIGYLKEYFLNGVKELSQADEVQQNQLIRFSKLFLQYSKKLSVSEKQPIRSAYLNHIIPYFNQSSQVLFYSILVVLRDKLPEPESPQEKAEQQKQLDKIKKYILQYLLSCTKTEDKEPFINRNINSAVQIYYQISRHQLQFRKGQLPNLLKYDFSARYTVQSQTIGMFLSYLLKARESKQVVHSVLVKLSPTIQLYLKNRKIRSIEAIFCLLNVCDKVNFEHNHLYRHVEAFFGNFMAQNPKNFIPEKDIRFILQKMVKRGYGSANLKQLIFGVLENPKNWPALRAQYTQKEASYKLKQQQKYKQRFQRYGSNFEKNKYPKPRQ